MEIASRALHLRFPLGTLSCSLGTSRALESSWRPSFRPGNLHFPLSRRCRAISLNSFNPLVPSRHRGHLLHVSHHAKHTLSASGHDVIAAPSEYAEDLSSSSVESDSTVVYQSPSQDVEMTENDRDEAELIYDHKMIKVCDKLIEVFMVDKPTTTDWRRLLAFSKEWSNLRPHFYKRCQERADAEIDAGMKHKLLRLGRKLKEIDDDVQRHNELLNVIKEAPSEMNDIVAKRRKDFTKEFFVHLHTMAESYFDNPAEQNALAKLGNTCLAAVQSYDAASESIEAINAAELKFQDILNSPTVDAACKKIDDLAQKNQLDSALMLLITKAWSAAKDSNMMKEEVKDILYHLYKTSVGNLQRLVPKEIRILKYLLTIEDPEEKLSALTDAFTPGDELEGKDVDCLYTTPEQLHTWIRTVVDAFHFSREGTLVREARDLMNPKIIQKLEVLKELIEKKFM